MRVILLEEVKGLGKKQDLKEVSEGYARNFLLPKKLAEAATPGALKRLIIARSELEAAKKKLIAELEEKAGKIKNLVLKFKLKTGAKDEVFGSVSGKDIKAELSRHDFPEAEIILEKPIKSLGETIVVVDLGEGVKSKVKVLVEAEK